MFETALEKKELDQVVELLDKVILHMGYRSDCSESSWFDNER
jgi:hypothetical protein